MARKQVLVQLDDELVERLDTLAEQLDVSRSELIRRGASAFVAAAHEAELDRQHAEGYRRIPQTAEEMEWIEAATEAALEILPEW